MAEVKWIKLMVGAFDGSSFKKIKKATLKDGTSYRDKLTAVWFELLDLAAKKNLQGQLCDVEDLEIPFTSEAQFEDIAIMIDRSPEEVECCIAWFVKNKMISIVDDLYMLSNWEKYQAEDKLAQIREQNRVRQKALYDRKKAAKLIGCDNTSRESNVSVTLPNALDIDKEIDIEEDKELEEENNNNNIMSVFVCWNAQKSTIKHREINDARDKAIKKALKKYSLDDITQAIMNYDLVVRSKYYFNFKWSLEDFLNRSNGISTFTNEGSNWCSFQAELQKNPYILPEEDQPKREKQEAPGFVKNFFNSVK